jgi:Transglycosylase SLT domain
VQSTVNRANPVVTFRLICLLSGVAAHAAAAAPNPADLCRDAAITAATHLGIPPQIMLAITLTETGRSQDGLLQPWPWAINHAGAGSWYASEEDALAAIDALTAQGQRNFDVGCFQLNHRWHAGAFTSAKDMIDPARNAAYAARFLLDKFAQTQDWGLAAAAYHSGTPAYASQYQARFEAVLANLPPDAVLGGHIIMAAQDIPERPNAFPLLLAGQRGSGASLVPLDQAARPLFGAGG